MPRLLFFTFFCLSAFVLTAQATFKKRFGTAGNDLAWFVEVLPDNSFIVAGASAGGGLGSNNGLLVKFSADGNVEWSKVYGGSGADFFGHIYSCSDGNFLALGETNSMGAGGFDIYVVKFDINGNVLWERTCGGSSSEGFRGICEVSDGYIITGNTQSFGNGNFDIFVEKLDFGGNSIWAKAWGSGALDHGGEPMPAPDGDVWVIGYLNVGSNNDGVLLRINASGTLVSATRMGGADSENLHYLAPGGPGLVGSGLSSMKPCLYGINPTGGLVWAKRYVMPSGNYEGNAEDCPSGGFIFAPYNFTAPVADGYLVKTDDNGNISWAKSYSFNGTGRMRHVRPAPDGGYVAVGYSSSGGQDLFILKTDANGNVGGCCPVDAPITMEVINPSNPGTSLPGFDCSAAAAPAGLLEPVDLTETIICNGTSCCITDAGTMFVQALSVCINLPATFTHNSDEVLDANDLLQFILFSDLNDTLGSIVATSNTPVFSFNPATMQMDVTYYIAAIAGNNVGGNVDLNDPCLDISNAAQLIWRPLPTVTFTIANPNLCAGECTTVTANFTGTAPFTLTYTTPVSGPMTQTFSGNTGTFQVCTAANAPPDSFVMQATKVEDAWCTCE